MGGPDRLSGPAVVLVRLLVHLNRQIESFQLDGGRAGVNALVVNRQRNHSGPGDDPDRPLSARAAGNSSSFTGGALARRGQQLDGQTQVKKDLLREVAFLDVIGLG